MEDVLENWLEIGTIVGSQGLQGEVKVLPNTDFPERFQKKGTRWLKGQGMVELQSIELQRGRYVPHKNLYIVKFAGIDNRNQADDLKGYQIYVPTVDRPTLAPGEFHLLDLIGLTVYLQTTGEAIGVIKSMVWAGNDLLEVQSNTSQKVFLIPFVEEIVPIVNIAEKRVEINPPQGLLDL